MTTYTATATSTTDRITVSISRDGVWAGTGALAVAKYGAHASQQWTTTIEGCDADLGEEVYEAIEEAISDEFSGWDGASAVHVVVAVEVEVDGE